MEAQKGQNEAEILVTYLLRMTFTSHVGDKYILSRTHQLLRRTYYPNLRLD